MEKGQQQQPNAPIGFAPYPDPSQQQGGYPPQQGVPQQAPPPAYSQGQQQQFQQQPGQSVTYVQTQQQPTGIIIPGIVQGTGTCPTCRMGNLESSFTVCGIVLGVLFFPLGVLCCFLMMEKKCTNCGSTF